MAVVKSIEDAINLSTKYPEFSFVTPEGEYISNNGIIETVSNKNISDSIFGRRQLLENLKNEFPKLEINL